MQGPITLNTSSTWFRGSCRRARPVPSTTTAIWVSEQVGGDEGATSGAPALSSHSPASSFPLGHHQPRCHTCHVQADCEGCRGGGRGGDGPGQMGPRSKNINIHPPCPPGYSVAVGEFSGDDTEGECVPRLRPRERVDGDPGTETLTILVTPCFPPLVHNFLFSLQTLLLACQKGTSPTVM